MFVVNIVLEKFLKFVAIVNKVLKDCSYSRKYFLSMGWGRYLLSPENFYVKIISEFTRWKFLSMDWGRYLLSPENFLWKFSESFLDFNSYSRGTWLKEKFENKSLFCRWNKAPSQSREVLFSRMTVFDCPAHLVKIRNVNLVVTILHCAKCNRVKMWMWTGSHHNSRSFL